jgi:hypothetical protein
MGDRPLILVASRFAGPDVLIALACLLITAAQS